MTMKWILVLMTCFVTGLTNQCEVGSRVDFSPEQLNGTWIIVYSNPDMSKKFYNSSNIVKLNGDGYDVEADAYVVRLGRQGIFKARWTINENNNTITVDFPDFPEYYASYAIKAIESGQYFILRGCCPGGGSDGMTLIFMANKCPTKQDMESLRQATEKIGMNFDDFVEDPVVKAECPPVDTE